MNSLTFPASADRPSGPPVQALPGPAPFRIAAGATLALRRGRDLRLDVIEGRLWVTAQGDARDHFVGPGGRHELGRARAVVIENVGTVPALVCLAPA